VILGRGFQRHFASIGNSPTALFYVGGIGEVIIVSAWSL